MASDSAGNLKRPTPTLTIRGFEVFKDHLAPDTQSLLVSEIRKIVEAAPLFAPVTASGKTMSVRMTSAGRVGWVTDRSGYRYEPVHPSGEPWPQIPSSILNIWREVAGVAREPDSCLVNYYGPEARMGLHQDRDEGDFSYPVVSISLGDDALFRMGGAARGEKTESLWLSSGDVVVLRGAARLAYHGVDRIKPGTSQLLAKPGRINLTLRVVVD